jgi:hypothetical protein
MKNLIYKSVAIIAAIWFFSCGEKKVSREDIKESTENMRETSEMLTDLPATYKGYAPANGYDSVLMTLTLEPGQGYHLTKEFYTGGNSDTVDYERGKWIIEGEDIITTSSNESTNGFVKFKIRSETHIQLTDSLGKEVGDGRNRDLIRIRDVTAGSKY